MRSTSGMICCHFFCSAVFSMPVCRKPIVGSTETMRLAVELEHQPQHAVRAGVLRPHVDGHRFAANLRHQADSPASSRLRLAHHVQASSGALPAPAALVDAAGTFTCTSTSRPRLAAVAARSAPIVRSPSVAGPLAAPRFTFADAPLVVMPIATSPGASERFDLPGEHLRRTRNRWRPPSASPCRPSARSPAIPGARARTGRPAPSRSAARRSRCRRCRTPAPCGRPSSASASPSRGRRRSRPPARRTRSRAARPPRRTRAHDVALSHASACGRPARSRLAPLALRAHVRARTPPAVICTGDHDAVSLRICTG